MTENGENVVRDRIRHVLSIFPKLQRSMLQVGIGTSLPPAIWNPVLDGMIAEGVVRVENVSHATPAGRHNSYTILSLSELDIVVTPKSVSPTVA